MAPRTSARVVTFSAEHSRADYYATDISLDDVTRASFTLHSPGNDPQRVELNVFGAHQVGGVDVVAEHHRGQIRPVAGGCGRSAADG